jgi:hypothetical protein
MPVVMRLEGLKEAIAFPGWLGVPGLKQPGVLEHAVSGRGADAHAITIEHHKSQAAITLERVLAGKVDDRLAFVGGDPMIARDQGGMFIGAAVTFRQSWYLRGERPIQASSRRQASSVVGIMAQEVADLVAEVTRHPETSALPNLFFVRTKSSMISAMTPSLRLTRASDDRCDVREEINAKRVQRVRRTQ